MNALVALSAPPQQHSPRDQTNAQYRDFWDGSVIHHTSFGVIHDIAEVIQTAEGGAADKKCVGSPAGHQFVFHVHAGGGADKASISHTAIHFVPVAVSGASATTEFDGDIAGARLVILTLVWQGYT